MFKIAQFNRGGGVIRRFSIILGLAAVAVAVFAGYQIGACELANLQLQDDMQDLASQLGTRIGYSQLSSDDDLRNAVIRKAKAHDIELEPKQVEVRHMGSAETSTVYLAADYTVPINFHGFAFTLHFTPATGKKLQSWQSH